VGKYYFQKNAISKEATTIIKITVAVIIIVAKKT